MKQLTREEWANVLQQSWLAAHAHDIWNSMADALMPKLAELEDKPADTTHCVFCTNEVDDFSTVWHPGNDRPGVKLCRPCFDKMFPCPKPADTPTRDCHWCGEDVAGFIKSGFILHRACWYAAIKAQRRCLDPPTRYELARVVSQAMTAWQSTPDDLAVADAILAAFPGLKAVDLDPDELGHVLKCHDVGLGEHWRSHACAAIKWMREKMGATTCVDAKQIKREAYVEAASAVFAVYLGNDPPAAAIIMQNRCHAAILALIAALDAPDEKPKCRHETIKPNTYRNSAGVLCTFGAEYVCCHCGATRTGKYTWTGDWQDGAKQ